MTRQELILMLTLIRDKADILSNQISIKEPVYEISGLLTEALQRAESGPVTEDGPKA